MLTLSIFGQQGVAYDLKKPARFENRTLASEKSGENPKKIKRVRRFIQNTVTHYNYYFNANEKLNQVIYRAKAQNRDDYTSLLPFYNYTLEATTAQKRELDSVIYKCTAGILIHDTRSDWVDNLYLLIGEAYYLRKEFDSAYITFQFLNFSFAPKEDDGYDKPIGSNANADEGGNANIVSTKEKRGIVRKAFSRFPSRNEALLWKIRTYLSRNQYAEATSLIEVLKHDPQFPPRLLAGLAEMQALSFYRQSINDSAAFYLEKALPAAANNEETARWEYLIAQLYERIGRSYEARTFYARTIRHTYNPVLEIYARLNAIRQNKEGGEDFIRQNINALVKMAHKDRYETYRDIIYYTAAQMELERNNKPGAIAFLVLCTRSTAGVGNTQRNKAFLLLANLSFEDKRYRAAKNYYDSLNIGDPQSMGDLSWLPDRRAALNTMVTQLQIMERQDSLQRIAALPPDQRDAYIKKLVKTLRKRQGMRDEGDSTLNNNGPLNNSNAAVPDLFSNGTGSADWYFNNTALKSKGYSDFKAKWGNRPNVDNWQLSSVVKNQQPVRPGERTAPGLEDVDPKAVAAGANAPLSFKSLMDNLPLTPEKMKKLSDSVERAMYVLGKTYQEGINDYQYAINTDDSLLRKFPGTFFKAEILLNMYYCYKKLGDEAGAERILALLKKNHPSSRATALASNPDSTVQAEGSLKVSATHQYERIYNSFIEGRFTEALADKRVADSLYGDKFWTPQLLYIEAVYHIRNREDQRAIAILGNIPAKYPKTPMAAKATALIDVLRRRREIEDYLTKLEVKRATDDDAPANPVLMPGKVTAPTAPRLVRDDNNLLIREDTSTIAKANVHAQGAAPGGAKPAPVISGMDKLKVDTASLNKATMDAKELTRLQNQMDSLNAAMAKAMQDSIQMVQLRHTADSIRTAVAKLKADSAAIAAKVKSQNTSFTFAPEKTHAVVIVLDKVDPVYVTETRNAFNRYNLENFYNQSLTINNTSLNDSLKLVVVNTFENSAAAMEYLQKAKAAAPREVVPWLPAGKYTFLVISAPNLELLLSNKDMPGYRKFLSTAYPDKF
jgi:tetratricopeptide (TPR) repeat protein